MLAANVTVLSYHPLQRIKSMFEKKKCLVGVCRYFFLQCFRVLEFAWIHCCQLCPHVPPRKSQLFIHLHIKLVPIFFILYNINEYQMVSAYPIRWLYRQLIHESHVSSYENSKNYPILLIPVDWKKPWIWSSKSMCHGTTAGQSFCSIWSIRDWGPWGHLGTSGAGAEA